MARSFRVVASSGIGLSLMTGVAGAAAAENPKQGASQPASVQPEKLDEEPGRYTHRPRHDPHFQLGLGAGVTLGLGDVWETSGDAINMASSPILFDLSVAPSYLVAPAFALGVRASVGLEGGTRGEFSSSGESVTLDRRMWQLSATARYQRELGNGWYFSVSAGAARMVDIRGEESTSAWAPLVGAAAGYDLRILEPLSLGLELRVAYADFGESTDLPTNDYDYRVSAWLGAGVVASVLP